MHNRCTGVFGYLRVHRCRLVLRCPRPLSRQMLTRLGALILGVRGGPKYLRLRSPCGGPGTSRPDGTPGVPGLRWRWRPQERRARGGSRDTTPPRAAPRRRPATRRALRSRRSTRSPPATGRRDRLTGGGDASPGRADAPPSRSYGRSAGKCVKAPHEAGRTSAVPPAHVNIELALRARPTPNQLIRQANVKSTSSAMLAS